MIRLAVVTRNAIHGGVESLIAIHQQALGADVFVAGGHDVPDTCPFRYRYLRADDPDRARRELVEALEPYDLVIYHWPPHWAVQAIQESGRPSIEYVHRTDTSDCDKATPTLVVTHSEFLAQHLTVHDRREALVVPPGVDVVRLPEMTAGAYVGAITTYSATKGIDLLLRAWAKVEPRLPGQRLRLYGAGDERTAYERLIVELGLRSAELRGPVRDAGRHLGEFRLFVQPSRVEGMPIAILEALACNIPVVCTDLPGMVEFNRLARERGFEPPLTLVRSEDVDDLASTLLRVLAAGPPPADTRGYIDRYYGLEPHCRALTLALGRALERAAVAGLVRKTFSEAYAAAFPEEESAQLRWLAGRAGRLRRSRWFALARRLWRWLP